MTPVFSNISFGKGEIYRNNNSIYISKETVKDTIKPFILFDFRLHEGDSIKTYFEVNGEKKHYEVVLKKILNAPNHSSYWFQIINNKILAQEVNSNFVVSPDKGIEAVFESHGVDTIPLLIFNLVGKLPDSAYTLIKVMHAP